MKQDVLSVLPEYNVRKVENALDASSLPAQLLRDFLVARRWFRSKARILRDAKLRELIPLPHVDSAIGLMDLTYAEGDQDTYVLTLALARGPEAGSLEQEYPKAAVARVISDDGEHALLYDAVWNPIFCRELLRAIGGNKDYVSAESGRFSGRSTHAFATISGGQDASLQGRASKAEQSNTSIIYGDRFILKLFRKLEPGLNPDFEIGRFLTEHGFKSSPAVAGHLEYRGQGDEPMFAGILLQYVANQGDAWEYTLKDLDAFYRRVIDSGAGKAPDLPASHPMELMTVPVPEQTSRLIGPYLKSAALLGRRTAQMHATLVSEQDDPEFAPEPLSGELRKDINDAVLRQMESTFRLLRDKGRGERARRVMAAERQVKARLDSLQARAIEAVRIRHHGDYHLGQVLYTGDDFLIIDFEGEPARSLEERRRKQLPMRDVAGMTRSFQYAAFAGLKTLELESPALEAWAAYWTGWVSAEFLKAYFDTAAGLPFLPSAREDRRLLFDVFLLEKALYEVSYELNNRPDWVDIPLSGILSILD